MLINPRWVDIPEENIYEQLRVLGIKTWAARAVPVAGSDRYYLFGGRYAYPYSLPGSVINRLAKRLNEAVIDMSWYKKYNTMAIDWFNARGEALNQAQEYWYQVGNPNLPKPEVLPVDGLENGDEYVAIIGLFHLPGSENGNNSHLFIDLIAEDGQRIYDHTPPLSLFWFWEGMTTEEKNNARPIRIDKPGNEPGANIGLSWGQVIYGFHINNVATDRFRGIHTRYENDGPGNNRGHHSHYIVLQKRIFRAGGAPPDPEPEPPPQVRGSVLITVNWAWVQSLTPDEEGNITIEGELN